MKIESAYWIPTITKVENGYIATIKAPNEDIHETYIFKTDLELSNFINETFVIGKYKDQEQ